MKKYLINGNILIKRHNQYIIEQHNILVNNHIIIVVKDNGVGFDISVLNHEATKASNKSIEHVKKCIEDMCNGTLLTESVLGIGTTTTIIIPKG